MNKKRLLVWMIILAWSAGIINTISVFHYAGSTVSHVTGLLSKLAMTAATGDAAACLFAFVLITAFFAGTIVTGIATGERAFYLHTVYGVIILVIGVLLLVPVFVRSQYVVFLLAFLMGLQNGMVVSFRGIVVRTTHMTGNLTDVGVYIGYRLRGNRGEKPITGLIPFASICGFVAGGVTSILLFKLIGTYVFVFASAVYILLGLIYFRLRKTCEDKDFNGIPDHLETKT